MKSFYILLNRLVKLDQGDKKSAREFVPTLAIFNSNVSLNHIFNVDGTRLLSEKKKTEVIL